MHSRGRGNSSYRGGRSNRNPSHRGGSGQGNILVQHGNKKLIASELSRLSDTNSNDIEEFKKWKELQRGDTSSSSSKEITPYKNIVKNKGKNENWVKSQVEPTIMLLKHDDKKWIDNPWTIYRKYLSTKGYPEEVYKPRLYYETILTDNGCEITHFGGINQTIYNFSKIIISRIISLDEWGISPYHEKVVVNNNNNQLRYNYWDYIQAFNKVFLYENDKQSHTWFIKLNSNILDHEIPTWIINWWQFYGTTEKILPEILMDLFHKWKEVIPLTENDTNIKGYTQLNFYIEFSIPWIWKNTPTAGYTMENIFCLKRQSYSRFWDKMMENDDSGQLNCALTINLINKRIKDLSDSLRIKKAEEADKISNLLKGEIVAANMSRKEIIRHHMISLKNILQNDDEKSEKSDTSMASLSSQNIFDFLQEGQDPEDDYVDIIEEAADEAAMIWPEGKGKEKI